jgi:hypothetical protein
MGTLEGNFYIASLVFYATPWLYYRHRSSLEQEFGGSHEEYLELLQALCKALERDGAQVYLIDFDIEEYRIWRECGHAEEPDTSELRTEWAASKVQVLKECKELIVPWRERLGLLSG